MLKIYFFRFFFIFLIAVLILEFIKKLDNISSNINLFKWLPFLLIFFGLCNLRTDSFHDKFLNFLRTPMLNHSSKSGKFFNTYSIIDKYFFSVNPSVRL